MGETKLNNKLKVAFQNYTIIRTDRLNSTQGGGTAILVNKNIPFKQLHFKNVPNENTLESTAIQISCLRNKKLIIASLYAAGNNNINITHCNSYFILAGDINARSKDWSDAATNSRGGYLTNWLNTNSINLRLSFYPPSEPTFPRSNSSLDHCIIDARLTIKNAINNKI